MRIIEQKTVHLMTGPPVDRDDDRKMVEDFMAGEGVKRIVSGGTTATTDFVGAATDGTAICLEAVGVFTLQPFVREVGYSIDDFTPVAGLTTEPIVMVASKNSGVKNMEELLAKGTVSYGFNGAGSLMELCQKKFFSKEVEELKQLLNK